MLQNSFGKIQSKQTQFFGKAQLKSIFRETSDSFSSHDIQNSINCFAYGLTHHSDEEPYKSMSNPAAVLFNHLKNGDPWIENKYISPKGHYHCPIHLEIAWILN